VTHVRLLDWSLDELVRRGDIDVSWLDALRPVEPQLARLAHTLSGTPFLPDSSHVFRALQTPLDAVVVLLLGQDPYPKHGLAMGLAFSVPADARPLPGSLRNICAELVSDLGAVTPATGDLTPWGQRGVLLLNRTLTVSPGSSGSHERLGWHVVTDAIITALADRPAPLVVLAWGRVAQNAVAPLAQRVNVRVIESAHPSPLSASRGFLGSKPFSRANDALIELGLEPVDWSL